jgi:hypothetical protein
MNTQTFPAPSSAGAITESGQRDQYNVLLWTSLADRILGLPLKSLAA